MKKKRLLAVKLSLTLCCSSFFVATGCTAKPFTVTFVPGAELNVEDAVNIKDEQNIENDKLYIDGDYVQTVTHASQLKPPKFARKGYVHQGWNKVLNNIKGDATVEAHWVQRSFEVIFEPGALDATYYLANGTDIRVKQIVGSGLELVPPIFERPGYDISWDYERISFIDDACTVTPRWIPKDYILSFADGTATEYEKLTVTYGELIRDGQGELPQLPDNANGQIFGGWKYITQPNESNEEYIIITENSEWVYPHDATLQALWLEIGQYRIDYENAFNHSNTLLYSENDTVVLTQPTRKGYEFIGWTYFGQAQPTKEVTIERGSTGNKQFTANWKAKQYTLIINAGNGGTCGVDGLQEMTLTIGYGDSVGKLPEPIRDGYLFVCWTTENGTVIEDGTKWNYDSPATLTAVYKRIYTIELMVECTVNSVKVVCTLPKDYINKYNLKLSQEKENVYIMDNYIEGSRLPELPRANPSDPEEYMFSSWRYEKVKKIAGTILSEKNFPNSLESGVIILKVSCSPLWTPFL